MFTICKSTSACNESWHLTLSPYLHLRLHILHDMDTLPAVALRAAFVYANAPSRRGPKRIQNQTVFSIATMFTISCINDWYCMTRPLQSLLQSDFCTEYVRRNLGIPHWSKSWILVWHNTVNRICDEWRYAMINTAHDNTRRVIPAQGLWVKVLSQFTIH